MGDEAHTTDTVPVFLEALTHPRHPGSEAAKNAAPRGFLLRCFLMNWPTPILECMCDGTAHPMLTILRRNMLAIALALLSALGYGSSDFLAGLWARRVGVAWVSVIALATATGLGVNGSGWPSSVRTGLKGDGGPGKRRRDAHALLRLCPGPDRCCGSPQHSGRLSFPWSSAMDYPKEGLCGSPPGTDVVSMADRPNGAGVSGVRGARQAAAVRAGAQLAPLELR